MIKNKTTKLKKNKKVLVLSSLSVATIATFLPISAYIIENNNVNKNKTNYTINLNNVSRASDSTNGDSSTGSNNGNKVDFKPSIPKINLTIQNDEPINISQLDANLSNVYNYDWWNKNMVNIFGQGNVKPTQTTPIDLDQYNNETVNELKEIIKNCIVVKNFNKDNINIKINGVSTGFNGSVYLGVEVSATGLKYEGGNEGDENYGASITPDYNNGLKKCAILHFNGFKKYKWGTYSSERKTVTFDDEESKNAFLNWKIDSSSQINISDSSFLPYQMNEVDQNSSDGFKKEFIKNYVKNNWIYLLNITSVADGPAIFKSDDLSKDDSNLISFIDYLTIETPTFQQDENLNKSMKFSIGYPSGLSASYDNSNGVVDENIITQLEFNQDLSSQINIGPSKVTFSNETTINPEVDITKNVMIGIDKNTTIDDLVKSNKGKGKWKQFVANNANVLFKDGYGKIYQKVSSIDKVEWKIQGSMFSSEKKLVLSITINAECWYNDEGYLEKDPKTFTIILKGFKDNKLMTYIGVGLCIGGGILLLLFMIILLVKKSKSNKNDPEEDIAHIPPQDQSYTMMNMSMYDPSTGQPNDPYYTQYNDFQNTYENQDQNPYMNNMDMYNDQQYYDQSQDQQWPSNDDPYQGY